MVLSPIQGAGYYFKALHGLEPGYLKDCLTLQFYVRPLRPSGSHNNRSLTSGDRRGEEGLFPGCYPDLECCPCEGLDDSFALRFLETGVKAELLKRAF